jgi:hypothetical protein
MTDVNYFTLLKSILVKDIINRYETMNETLRESMVNKKFKNRVKIDLKLKDFDLWTITKVNNENSVSMPQERAKMHTEKWNYRVN